VSTTHSFQQLKNLFLGGCWWDGGGTTQIKLKMGLTLSKKMCIYIYYIFFYELYMCVFTLEKNTQNYDWFVQKRIINWLVE
jgi:hypothetical protein